LVLFNDPQSLTRVNNGYFTANHPSLQPTVTTDARVCQGYVESANTTPMREMAQMMVNIRQYETNQRVIQLNDERMGRTITELGMAG
jgi:flagellar basal-body rod protein FlgG